ncbi:rhomboid family intramembrane serine protease [Aquisalimonas lutea]|uniref:rhomboid family intramembrane serine protease n=1 Tax=Aquisalimonas lutea TaxID=1327750 RepID=UPI0025B61044|nr:rhomboid family intramembrane serine protease [Aquisalimonas lutea]MDN3519429.1 rhomboid family intramembrane serine protease [Aquisalimonas lutea]
MTVTLALILVTAAISVYAWRDSRVLEKLVHWPPGVRRGEWWRLLSHGFIHADAGHLVFNMITLFFFGRIMEQVLIPRIGAAGFVLFYLAGIVLAALPSQFRHRDNPRFLSLGASGAVAAVLFAYILIQPWAMLVVFVVPVPAIVFAAAYVGYSLWAEHQGGGRINHSAHLGGAAWGVIFLAGLEPAVLPHFLAELVAPLQRL